MADLSNKDYTIEVKAFDRGGNTATDSLTFTVQIKENEIGGVPTIVLIGIGAGGAIAAIAIAVFFFMKKKKEG